MKVLTKNYGIESGERKYLTYLMDENNKPLECFDTNGEVERTKIENELLNKYDLSTDNLEFVTLEEYYRQDVKKDEALILVFYLDQSNFVQQDLLKAYSENVKRYFDDNGDNVRLFFIPTKGQEKIECINPVYLTDRSEIDKLNDLTSKLEEMFQVGVD
jgi:hypothetical protein